MSNDINNAHTWLTLAQQHYENFPTASRLLAAPHRQATAVIYSFARIADDIADEGDLEPAARHQQLDAFAAQLACLKAGNSVTDPLFVRLGEVIRDYRLPFVPFEKLLSAFRDDIDVHRYATYAQLLDYCRRSANPVGELVLRLHGQYNAQNSIYADHICTALQLINFMQDLASDYHQRQRLYIPLDEFSAAGVTEQDLQQYKNTPALHRLVEQQLSRAEMLLCAGIPLLKQMPWRLRLVLRLTVLGGLRMIGKLRRRDTPYLRPTLNKADMLWLVSRCIYSSHLLCHGKIQP